MFKNALIAALAALVLVPAAQAAVPIDQAVPADALAVARAQWPDSPCAGREQIEVMDGLIMHNGVEAGGWAYFDNRCLIEIKADWLADSWNACRVLTHELGHLAGWKQHSADPNDIMYAGQLPLDFAPCAVLLPPEYAPAPATSADADAMLAAVEIKIAKAKTKARAKRHHRNKKERRHRAA